MRNTFKAAAAALVALAACGPPSRAQSSGVNPDISVIPSFIVCPQGADRCSYGEADGDIEFQELELALQGYVSPFVRADVFAAYHAGDFEVEEAYATFVRGLGPFQARIGKYRVDWGTVNPLHPHAYSWIFQPLVEERFFGEEGLNQIGGGANVSFPAGERGEFTLSTNVLRGDIHGNDHAHAGESEGEAGGGSGIICVGPGCVDGACVPSVGECALVPYSPASHETESAPEMAYHLRTSYFNEFKPSHSILVGASALRGTLDPALDRQVTWLGADFKYRWRPNKYKALNLIGSYIRSRADLEAESVSGSTCVGPDCAGGVCTGPLCQEIDVVEHVKSGNITTSGWYLVADWQFAVRWNAGAKLDRSEGLETADAVRRAEAFVNFRLMEESTLFRLLFRREDGDGYDAPVNTTALQFLFSLGPHRPHAF